MSNNIALKTTDHLDQESQQGEFICLGAIAGAHGIRGEVKVKSFTEDPKDIGTYDSFILEGSGKTLQVKSLRHTKDNNFVVNFDEISDRNAAEEAKGKKLLALRSVLPDIESSDEFYFDSLVGLKVYTNADTTKVIGSVSGVFNFGAGDLIEVTVDSTKSSVLVPFMNDFVPTVDLDGGFIIVCNDYLTDIQADVKQETKRKGRLDD